MKEQVNNSGSIKTQEITDELIKYCQRDITDQQLFCEIREHLIVGTYQALQRGLIYKIPMDRYDYIICDECHYFFSDAMFNLETDIAWDFLWRKRKQSIVIYMSATAKPLFNLIEKKEVEFKRETIRYSIEKQFDMINKIIFYSNTEELSTSKVYIMAR